MILTLITESVKLTMSIYKTDIHKSNSDICFKIPTAYASRDVISYIFKVFCTRAASIDLTRVIRIFMYIQGD